MYEDIEDPEMIINFDYEEDMDMEEMIDELEKWGTMMQKMRMEYRI